MAYYDRIAKQWHNATGYKGGAFKQYVLNDALLEKLPDINGLSILELGAGNGYFLPLVMQRFSGQVPAKVVVTDQSRKLLDIAQRHLTLNAQYQVLDVRSPFPFQDGEFDIIIASMMFNEVSPGGFKRALGECQRVLSGEGVFLISVIHPAFTNSLRKRGELKWVRGVLTMPGAGNLRLPLAVRSLESYRSALAGAGFDFEEEDLFPTSEILKAKPGLRKAGRIPLGLVFRCIKSQQANKAASV